MTNGAAPGGNDRPERPLLYMFQHVALREAAFENHPELMRELEEGPTVLPLLHFRSRAHLHCARAGWIAEDEADEEASRAEDDLFDAVRIRPYRRGGHTVHVVTMPAPRHGLEAHFVAIVHRDDEPHEHMHASPSTRYFTLEKADAGRPVLCEWLRDGSHLQYGPGPAADVDAFAAAVLAHLSR